MWQGTWPCPSAPWRPCARGGGSARSSRTLCADYCSLDAHNLRVARSKQCGAVQLQLRVAFEWWAEVLALELCVTRVWTPDRREAAQLFVDARSAQPRVAA
eukprot:8679162-Pyramimonas_sp.AAC.1